MTIWAWLFGTKVEVAEETVPMLTALGVEHTSAYRTAAKPPEPEETPKPKPPKHQVKIWPQPTGIFSAKCPKCDDTILDKKYCSHCELNDEREHLHTECDCGFKFLLATKS